MSDKLFPSGPWIGFYNYQPKNKHRMDLFLTFANGAIHGDGSDDVGRFVLKGQYDLKGCECHWTKTYVGGHDVFYRGFREGEGIWGVWKINDAAHGGFHIWPYGVEKGDALEKDAENERPAKAPRLLPAPRQSALRRPRRPLK